MDAVEELIDDPDSELIDVIIISDPEFGSDLCIKLTDSEQQIDDVALERDILVSSTSTSTTDKTTYGKQKFSEKWLQLP